MENNSTENTSRGVMPADIIKPLQRIVRRNAARWRTLAVLETLGLAIAVLLAYLWIIFYVDNRLHLPDWGRIAAGGLFFVSLAWLLVRLVRTWRRCRMTEDEAALAIERQTPDVQNRLINSLQLAREDRLPENISQAVVEENFQALQKVQLQQAKKLTPALVRLLAAGLAIGAGVVFWQLNPQYFSNAATRIFMPFAKVAPIYRTTLTVTPGDVKAQRGEDVAVTVKIDGEIPQQLTIYQGETNQHVVVPVEQSQREVAYTFKAVDKSTLYAVRGNDFTSPYYKIEVPLTAQLSMVKGTLQYPAYTKLPPQDIQSTSGNLEALTGTKGKLTFILDNPAASAALLVYARIEKDSDSAEQPTTEPVRIELKKEAERQFSAELVFDHDSVYRLETTRTDGPAYVSHDYALRATADQAPEPMLMLPNDQEEVLLGSALQLDVSAKDDYGLTSLGLLYRRVVRDDESGEWEPIQTWDLPAPVKSQQEKYPLNFAALGAAEGDRFELAPVARDNDPAKADWTYGPSRSVLIGGEGVALQVMYERILATEQEIREIIQEQRTAASKTATWFQKLDPVAGTDWNAKENTDELTTAMAGQAKLHENIKAHAGDAARAMVSLAGDLRLSLGMVADTEMAQSIRIFQAVPKRETQQEKRAAIGDAQQTQRRTLKTLQSILDDYVVFRQNWELANMMPFLKMLADRQERMSTETPTQPAEILQNSMLKRQAKVLYFTDLAQKAFSGMSERVEAVGEPMAAAFGEAAKEMETSGVKAKMQQAADQLKAAHAKEAAATQKAAADDLNSVYAKLKKAQADVTRDLMAMLKKQLDEQKKIKDLNQSYIYSVDINEEEMNITDLVRLQQDVNDNKRHQSADRRPASSWFDEAKMEVLRTQKGGAGQNTDLLSLGDKPSSYGSFPDASGREPNAVTPPFKEEYEDLVGDLLDEADDLMDDYDTYNLGASFAANDPGDVQKMAGPVNSYAGSASTGNQKAPPHDFGGASRMGRQGARAHGLAMGSQSINRRGRDKALDSQERIADQKGVAKEIQSDDPQTDFATGTGGKLVDSKEPSFFNTKNSGRWSNDIVNRMRDPKALHMIVERQAGPPIDAKVSEMLHDLESRQQQVVQRINALRKRFNKLYLPTDELDEITRQLAKNLDRLKEQPDPEVFRRQKEILQNLKSVVLVFSKANSDFQPSLPREQTIEGRVLDEPKEPAIPKYEEAIKLFYEKLSGT